MDTGQTSLQDAADKLAAAGLGSMKLADLQRAAMWNALNQCGGNRTHAAALLGISTRTLQRTMKQLGWDVPLPSAARSTPQAGP